MICSKVFGPVSRPYALGDLGGVLCWPAPALRRWVEASKASGAGDNGARVLTEDGAALMAGQSTPLAANNSGLPPMEEKLCEAISAKKGKRSFAQVIFARSPEQPGAS